MRLLIFFQVKKQQHLLFLLNLVLCYCMWVFDNYCSCSCSKWWTINALKPSATMWTFNQLTSANDTKVFFRKLWLVFFVCCVFCLLSLSYSVISAWFITYPFSIFLIIDAELLVFPTCENPVTCGNWLKIIWQFVIHTDNSSC